MAVEAAAPTGTEHAASVSQEDDGYGDDDFESEEPALRSTPRGGRGGSIVQKAGSGGLGDGIIDEEGEGFRIVKTSSAGDDFQVPIKPFFI